MKIKTRIYAFQRMVLWIPALAGAAFLLAGCGQEDAQDAVSAVENGDYTKALEMLAPLLAAKPDDTLLHTLKAEAQWGACVATNCLADAPEMLDGFEESLAQAELQPLEVDEGTTVHLTDFMMRQAAQVATLPNQPAPLLQAINALAATPFQLPYMNLFFEQVRRELEESKNPADYLQRLAGQRLLDGTSANVVHVLLGYYTNEDGHVRQHLPGLADKALPAEAAQALAMGKWQQHILADAKAGTQVFLETFFSYVQQHNLKPTAPMAELMQGWRQNQAQQAKMLAHGAGMDAPTLDLYLQKLALLLDPRQTGWQAFLDDAKRYSLQTGDASMLAGLQRQRIPEADRATYTENLLAVLKNLAERGKNVLPLLADIDMDAQTNVTRLQIQKAIQTGLEQAMQQQNLTAIMAYAQVAQAAVQERRQNVVPMVIERMRQAFAEDDFDQIKALETFLTDTLDVSFQLNNILRQEFTKYLRERGLQDAVSTDAPDVLLRPQAEIVPDLGAKYTFFKAETQNNPELLDGTLRNILLNAAGLYGPPTAVYRLGPLFREATFPPAEQADYLLRGLQNALQQDKTSSAAQLAQLGARLHRQHPDLALAFVATEALKRVDSLAAAEDLWRRVDERMRATLQVAQPAYGMLMRAIDAYNADDFKQAAVLFAQVQAPPYNDFAQPYIAEYYNTLSRFAGIYAPADLTRADLPLLTLKVEAPATQQKSGNALTMLNISLRSRVGHYQTVLSDAFKSTYGRIYRVQVPARLDFGQLEATLMPAGATGEALPAAFEALFGSLERIRLSSDQNTAVLTAELADGSTVAMQKIATENNALIPQGTYTMTQQLQGTGDERFILPQGATLAVDIDTQRSVRPQMDGQRYSAVHPLTAKVTYPGKAAPVDVSGFYDPSTMLMHLRFDAPLPAGTQSAPAMARCQAVHQQIVCGVHYRHNRLNAYGHVVYGRTVQ